MAIPAGISTALVHLDAPVSFTGDPGQLHVTIKSSVPLIWAATGTPLANFIDSINPGEGTDLAVELPHTDQDGFLDGNGNSFKGWSYIVEITYEKGGEQVHFPAREFQILTGQDEVDLALVPAGVSSTPVVAPILPVTSIAGFTGPVTLAQLQLDLVDNTADVDKPISIAAQTALDGKEPTIVAGAVSTYFRGDKSWAALDKAAVGLGNVNNTSDAAKPVSDATSAALAGKSNTGHGHSFADISGVIGTSQLPPLAINETFPVASQAEMLALVAQRGDVAIRSDLNKTFILASDNPGTLTDWKEMMASGQVISVAGKTGAVVLAKADVGLSNVDNTSDANKPISTAVQTALDGKAPVVPQLGTAANPVTNAAAARPTGIPSVWWTTPTQPANWASGDMWVVSA